MNRKVEPVFGKDHASNKKVVHERTRWDRRADRRKAVERKQTIAVAESSTGGLISAALLAVPGASAYFLGGAVSIRAMRRRLLMDIPDEAMRESAPPRGRTQNLLASQIRQRFFNRLGPVRDRRQPADRQSLRRRRRPIAAWRSRG